MAEQANAADTMSIEDALETPLVKNAKSGNRPFKWA